jgi:hypothetical protein
VYVYSFVVARGCAPTPYRFVLMRSANPCAATVGVV